MSSDPPSPREPVQTGLFPTEPQILWARIAEAFDQVRQTQEARLQEEATGMGLELDTLWGPLLSLPAAEKLHRFTERNPQIDPRQITTIDPYEIAVGVLRIFIPSS